MTIPIPTSQNIQRDQKSSSQCDSLNYYNQNAQNFFNSTIGVDMSALHERFLLKVPPGGYILDAGCGSGRDARAFKDCGYRVAAFDASPKLAELACIHAGQEIDIRSFADVDEETIYDGIWACASLLHLPMMEIPDAIARLWRALKPGGVLYVSFKEGNGERTKDGRHFTDLDEPTLRRFFAGVLDVEHLECWQTADVRPDKNDLWLNALIHRQHHQVDRLITGGEKNPFLPCLLQAIRQSEEIDMAVAFIKATGLRLLFADLKDAITPSEESTRKPARLRIITSDYLDVTDPESLRSLMLLKERGAQIRVYEASDSSFHMKAYIFARRFDRPDAHGMAFIGSSNISKQALQGGLEWNYRIDADPQDNSKIAEIRSRFEELFAEPKAVPLTHGWIDSYENRRRLLAMPVAPGSHELEPPPTPSEIQIEALLALKQSRENGYRRGLVVMATGLGKTWLAAFDCQQVRADRVLFVAHREEILFQAEDTFLRIRPNARVGYYTGQNKDDDVDILCASVQTLCKTEHINQFAPRHFDYVIVDEFHHAAAATYRRLLSHFKPKFLLGLTATPDRTDQSDILSLCDDNLVFNKNLFAGINSGLLAPFSYHGIFDEEVNYREIPWRNGKFDPEQLSNKLATMARARHAHQEWTKYAQRRTLAFCISIRHAEFMSERFQQMGVRAAAVYAGSPLSRGEALAQLRDGRLRVVFSVDLFNEGVDLPAIDTVMLLRPTESKILFLQQIGRGLRKAEGKERLVILDFIGNHHSFLHKPQALFNVGSSYKALADFARQVEQRCLALPNGCYANYDLQLIQFLKELDGNGAQKEYEALRETFGRRPTLSEFYRSGASVRQIRQQTGAWFSFVGSMGDLEDKAKDCAHRHKNFLRDVETTAMTRCFKMILLEALLENSGLTAPPTLEALSKQSLGIFQRRRNLIPDISPQLRNIDSINLTSWQNYWEMNPINAWIGGNRRDNATAWFQIEDGRFLPRFKVQGGELEVLSDLIQEIVDYRLASYEARDAAALKNNVVPIRHPEAWVELPFFPNFKIACGHFKTGKTDAEEYRKLGLGHGILDPARHFIARAMGNSMSGGDHPIHDGDYLLLELVSSTSGASMAGDIMAIERHDSGENQYLLRLVAKDNQGREVLKATNPEYQDLETDEYMRPFARLIEILDPLELSVGRVFMREDIPALFGEEFNVGNWNVGHVVLPGKKAHILLVTINKQGKSAEHRYHDYWVDEQKFHWQSQNSTTPESKKGRNLIGHEKEGYKVHIFVREGKLSDGKAAPFKYYGEVVYLNHKGSAPMSIEWRLQTERR